MTRRDCTCDAAGLSPLPYMSLVRAVRGMNDLLPAEMTKWAWVESTFADALSRAAFAEVRTPIVEATPLFVRAVGETTDVVEKEMYSFVHHDDALTLRPEGTAGAVRAYLEHTVHAREPITRWYYAGPMFRGERPAKGRYRQFYQIGAEILGDAGPGCDAELIDLLHGVLQALRIPDVEVIVNSLGGPTTRERYREALIRYFEPLKDKLSADSQRRLSTNALRILDSKNTGDRELAANAPTLHEFLSPEDDAHFALFLRCLDALGTPYRVEPRLVRGLDYYTRTLFEMKASRETLGAGDTVLGGGRYDGLVAELGGPQTPAVGFAAGLERLMIASSFETPARKTDAYVVPLGDEAKLRALVLGRDLRRHGCQVEIDTRGTSLKSQLRRADALASRFALIIGDSEIAEGVVVVKDLVEHSQSKVATSEVAAHVANVCARGSK